MQLDIPYNKGLIIILFDFSGNTSNFFREKGFEVIQYDCKLDNFNVIQAAFLNHNYISGLICYPPCTYFSKARKKPDEFDLDYGLSTLDLCFRFKYLYNPKVFIIENPFHSRIRNYIGEPAQTISMGSFGFPTEKLTGLWGDFTPIKPGTNLDYKLSKKSFDNITKSKRSETPIDLIEAIYNSNFK